jgi:hypothetical protein
MAQNHFVVDQFRTNDDIQSGLNWFIGASLVQMIVGVWYFLSLPEHVRQLFMGNHTFGTTIFLLAIPLIVLMLVGGVKNMFGWLLLYWFQ